MAFSEDQEFFIFDCEWPSERAEQLKFLKSIPPVMWNRNPQKAMLFWMCGAFIETVEMTTDRGTRSYQIWNYLDFGAVVREPPSTLVILAHLESRGPEVSVRFNLVSGQELAETTFDLKPGEPLVMGHLTRVAYQGIIDAHLFESIYQDVNVLLDGFSHVVPDGVILWERSKKKTAKISLVTSLQQLQKLSPRALATRDSTYLPGFVGPFLEQLKQLLPSQRLLPWLKHSGGKLH